MLAKYWKKIALFILIIACLWNIVSKLVSIISFDKAMDSIKTQIQSISRKREVNYTK